MATQVEYPIPNTMKSPSDHRKGIWREGVLQIWITRACDKACVGCTQGSNLAGTPAFMTPDQFREACKSLKGYFGVVGVFGGNPTLHPQFEEICRIMQEEIPWQQRGLWSNNLRGKGAICRETFNPEYSNLNVHLDQHAYEEMLRDWPESHPKGHDSDSRHAPWAVAMKDVIEDEAERWKLISNCDVNQRWSSMICVVNGQLRAFFCELAGAMAMHHQKDAGYVDLGLPVVEGWWMQPMNAFADQVRKFCHECGIPLRGAGDLAVNGRVEQVSKTHFDIYKPKVRGRQVQLVTLRSELGATARATDYIENADDRKVLHRPKVGVKRIDGLVACVGKTYADQLRKSIGVWLSTLDTLTIVTSPDDVDTLQLCADVKETDNYKGNLRLETTCLFYNHGAQFNKGAALDLAFSRMQDIELDWILNFDADIIPPSFWRDECVALERNAMYSADRYYNTRNKVPDWPFGCGFFQLWHIDDPVTWVRPIYDNFWTHAGNYDTTHLERWPEGRRLPLNIRLTHQGEPRQNWFGVDTNPDAQKQMSELHNIGLREVWLHGEGRLNVPDFTTRVCFEESNPEWIRHMLRLCTVTDPFRIQARVMKRKDWKDDGSEVFIHSTASVSEAAEIILRTEEEWLQKND